MIDVGKEQLRNPLIERYRQLSPVDRKIMQLFSVIYEPVNRAKFLTCVNQSGIRNNKQVFTSTTLRPHLERLLEQGLLTQERTQGPKCHPLVAEVITRDAVKAGQFDVMAAVVQDNIPVSQWSYGPRLFKSNDQLLREVRIGIYGKDLDFISDQIEHYEHYGFSIERLSPEEIFQTVCNNPFDPDWLNTLPQDLYEAVLASLLTYSSCNLSPAEEQFTLLQEECLSNSKRCSDYLRLILTEQLLLRSCVEEAQQVLEGISAEYKTETAIFWGWLTTLKGDYAAAIAYYKDVLQQLKKNTGKRKPYIDTTGGLFYVLALLQEESPQSLTDADTQIDAMVRQTSDWLSSIYTRLQQLVKVKRGDLAQKEALLNAPIQPQVVCYCLEPLIQSLCLYWVDSNRAKKSLPRLLDPFYRRAAIAGYHWLAMEVAELLARLDPDNNYGEQANLLREGSGIQPLVDMIQPQETWELCLNALTQMETDSKTAAQAKAERRLVWFVTFYSTSWVLQPREQKINVRGVWSKGRTVSLKRLADNPREFDYLTPQDRKVCDQIEIFSYGYYHKTEYTFGEQAIAALIGHPLVFWEDLPNTRIDIVKGEPELLVQKGRSKQLTLQLSPQHPKDKTVAVIKESPTRLKVIKFKAEHRRIADILGQNNRLQVPEIAKERVLAAINAVSSLVTVHSDIGGGVASAEEVMAQPQPHIHLLPAGEGLKVAVLARPFPGGGPYYRPGTGGETVIAEIEGKRLQTTRQLKEEKKLANAAVTACPTLEQHPEVDGEWLIDAPEDCLELLLELQDLGDKAILEWPKGEKFRVSHRASLDDLQMKIKRQQDWFAASGELQLDDNLVLDMQQLLTLLEKTPGRFVELEQGQFLALTREFRKRLDELRGFSETHGKGVRFHPLAALALEDVVDEVGQLKADKHWKAHIRKLKEAQDLQPQLPSTLQAELRDYQIDGFNWLARLAHWGVGACLADDMGLGKTLQALSVILTHAPEGPTLIVAPTSVGMNWIDEAQRFAPTLNPIEFGSKDRQQVLDRLQPFDLLICTYGLLQQEELAQQLAEVEWQTIVLDEAQAIKNMATKRSQAAMKLQGGFKLITTGTPIENHLGELWNLFRFINPGLLSSLDSFNQRFANPIEKYKDKAARVQLKKLIQPFLLRRTKNQVLEELPSRTEILLHVDLSQEEMAFYEALRRDAIAKLSNSKAEAGPKHLQVLAEIMKLRRACCNAQLVMPDTPLPSAKLQLFSEVLEELLDNHHKALVFSQFVDHLSILRDHLDQQNIEYQYLDGSTPAKDRRKRVNAFQAGEGDVFLISLKAGGTGLNLTAADYVIHMDPWWNPAVEDQASDRAHRIGQQRPVTIYRLVAKDTIEEKIVDLHRHKRDLADSLLEGADMSGKMSTEALLALIHER